MAPSLPRTASSFAAVAALACLAGGGCSGGETVERCTGTGPTFHLVVSSPDGPLPPDTTIRVRYGGGVETFALADPGRPGDAVLCRATGPGDATLDAGAAEAIACDLWTDGAAHATVTAGGYPAVERDLVASPDGCLTDARIELAAGDAG